MDKEKQIEELYHILAMEMANELPFIETCELGANAIYKANYRKILENEVVISKEEYRKLKLKRKNAMAMETARKICEHIENDNKKIRKETAEKIFNGLHYIVDALMEDDIKEMIKREVGVEIKE